MLGRDIPEAVSATTANRPSTPNTILSLVREAVEVGARVEAVEGKREELSSKSRKSRLLEVMAVITSSKKCDLYAETRAYHIHYVASSPLTTLPPPTSSPLLFFLSFPSLPPSTSRTRFEEWYANRLATIIQIICIYVIDKANDKTHAHIRLKHTYSVEIEGANDR